MLTSFIKRRAKLLIASQARLSAIQLIVLCLLALQGCVSFPEVPHKSTVRESPITTETTRKPIIHVAAKRDFDLAMSLIREADLESDNVKQGEAKLDALLASFPNYQAVRLNLGILYSKLDRPLDAIKLLEIADASCPLLVEKGRLLRQQHAISDAELAYLRCIDKEPDNELARFNLGILYELYIGDLKAALEQYQHYQQVALLPDQRVSGWIADLSRRIESSSQVARRTP